MGPGVARRDEIDELAAVAGRQAVLVDHQEVLMVGRAAERGRTGYVEDLEGEAADVRHAIRLHFGAAVGEPRQHAMRSRGGEQAVASMLGQPVQHLERAARASSCLRCRARPLPYFAERLTLQVADHLGRRAQMGFLVGGNALLPGRAGWFHALQSSASRRGS
jgi:hypothetical protein